MEHVINRDQIMHLVKYALPGKLPEELIKYLSKHMRVSDLVLDVIQDRDDKNIADITLLQIGMTMSFDAFASIAYDVLDNQADPLKGTKHITEENYAMLAQIFMARNPRGTADGDHELGKFFFAKFLKMCEEKRSDSWESITPGMKEYVDLCLTKSLLEQEQLND